MKFIALMLLMILGRFKSRPEWATAISHRYSGTGEGWFQWGMLVFYLVIVELVLLQFAFWGYGAGILLIELLILFIYLPNWSAYDLNGGYAEDWLRGDYQAAYLDAATLFDLPLDEPIDDARSVHYAVCKKFTFQSLNSFFLLLFWYICLGIPGLFLGLWAGWILNREEGRLSVSAVRFARLLSWLPCRLLGYSFFIVGNAMGAYDQLKHHANKDLTYERWIFHIALGAIGEDSQHQYANPKVMSDSEFRLQARDELNQLTILVRRSAVLWLVVFGLLTMLGIESPLH